MPNEAPKSDKVRQLIRMLDGSIDDARRRRLGGPASSPSPASSPAHSPSSPQRATPKR